MSTRLSHTTARRLAIAAATGVLAAAAAVTPAAAHDALGDDPGTGGYSGYSGGNGLGGNGRGGDGHRGDHHDPGRYKGVVTAGRLALRSAPNRGSQVIRYAHRGETVSIHCKTGGESVKGNPLWYLLADGTWAWGSARYIDNIGPAPRWC
ncbi:SH3 domain-containing protein [Streptomyces sp. NPDC006134]|uniref:SH3 domain-containing protein n=1 Tax=Streptomyces sp. NPDC006134 TaxID=3154467 RepID=UPI00340221D8